MSSYSNFISLKKVDKVCYRILMELCGKLGHPALAVRVREIKRDTMQFLSPIVLRFSWKCDGTEFNPTP